MRSRYLDIIAALAAGSRFRLIYNYALNLCRCMSACTSLVLSAAVCFSRHLTLCIFLHIMHKLIHNDMHSIVRDRISSTMLYSSFDM